MTLSTVTILRARSPGVNGVASSLVAVVCAASAGVHAMLVPDHLAESVVLGAGFALDALLLVAAAVLIDRPGGRHALPVGGLLTATALAYVLSRTTGIPVLVTTVEPVDPVGLLVTLSELVGAVACLLLILRRERR